MEDHGADALLSLHRLLTPERPLEVALDAVAESVCSFVPDVDLASVTLMRQDKPRTAVSTNDDATAADEAQYQADDGPCLSAIREKEVITAVLEKEDRWPLFTEAALAHDVRSVLSLPLSVSDRSAGGLNLYSRRNDGFSDQSITMARAFAEHAATAVGNSLLLWEATEQLNQLRVGLQTRDVIGQAKGILMAQEHITADAAFTRLAQSSQRRNVKLRAVAEEVTRLGTLDWCVAHSDGKPA